LNQSAEKRVWRRENLLTPVGNGNSVQVIKGDCILKSAVQAEGHGQQLVTIDQVLQNFVTMLCYRKCVLEFLKVFHNWRKWNIPCLAHSKCQLDQTHSRGDKK
jgi:hypothetical protein